MDLTDEQWNLIAPLIPNPRVGPTAEAAHAAIRAR